MTETIGDTNSEKIIGVVVTHKRRELLAQSLKVLAGQTRPLDHLVVVDNADEADVRELVESADVPTTYLGSKHNLGGAGGFALGILYALSLGADWVWLADDDGRLRAPTSWRRCSRARSGTAWRRSPPSCATSTPRTGWRFRSARRRVEAAAFRTRRRRSAAGIASLFNGALFSAAAIDTVGVPDLRLFVRGDEVEVHRRLVRSGLPFGTCLQTAYVHPDGADEFKPILGGRMHTQYPDNETKRFFTYRNRGYLMSQPGMRRLLPRSTRDSAGTSW